MAQAGIAAGPLGAASHALSGVTRTAARHIRITVLLCVVLICGSFAAAGALQMRIGREHALQQAASLEVQRAHEIAGGLGDRLDRNAAVAAKVAGGGLDAGALETFLAAHASALRNIAVVDETGVAISALRKPGFLPLAAGPADARLRGPRGGRIGIVAAAGLSAERQRDGGRTRFRGACFRRACWADSALTDGNGLVLAKGRAWTLHRLPSDLPAGEGADVSDGQLVSAVSVPGWPLRVAGMLDVEGAVGAWYGSLPLYLFVILGPALAGAGLAVVFVREFERRVRANDALQRLRNTSSSDARLLIRLAEAERRASEAVRSKSEFIAHMSHELRTPLNAIIGFSEIISHGFLGQAGHPKYIEYARDIGVAGRDLHGKIGDILEFANVEAGRHPISLCARGCGRGAPRPA